MIRVSAIRRVLREMLDGAELRLAADNEKAVYIGERSTTLNLLETLEGFGYVERDAKRWKLSVWYVKPKGLRYRIPRSRSTPYWHYKLTQKGIDVVNGARIE